MSLRARHKNLIFAASMLSLFAYGPCQIFGSVLVYEVIKTGQHAHIVTKTDGQPLAGVIVEVYDDFGPRGEPPATKPRLVLKSDSRGEVVLPRLPHGEYYIKARSEPRLEGFLYLKIPLWKSIQTRTLTLSLIEAAPSFEERLAALEALTNVETMTTFHGIVCDPVGGPLPNSTLKVLVRGTAGKQSIAELKTDKDGRFNATLPEGRYVVLVSSPGFASSLLPIAISASGSNEEIQIKLQLVMAT